MDDITKIEIDQEAIDKFIEALEEFRDAILKLWERIKEKVLQALEALHIALLEVTRDLFAHKLSMKGIPFSSTIAHKWPARWLPYRWIWSLPRSTI